MAPGPLLVAILVSVGSAWIPDIQRITSDITAASMSLFNRPLFSLPPSKPEIKCANWTVIDPPPFEVTHYYKDTTVLFATSSLETFGPDEFDLGCSPVYVSLDSNGTTQIKCLPHRPCKIYRGTAASRKTAPLIESLLSLLNNSILSFWVSPAFYITSILLSTALSALLLARHLLKSKSQYVPEPSVSFFDRMRNLLSQI